MYNRTSDYEDSLVHYLQVSDCFDDDFDDKILRAKILEGMGMVYSSMGEIDQSISCQQDAIIYFRQGD